MVNTSPLADADGEVGVLGGDETGEVSVGVVGPPEVSLFGAFVTPQPIAAPIAASATNPATAAKTCPTEVRERAGAPAAGLSRRAAADLGGGVVVTP
jgi:hypothetical protein